MFQFYFNTQSVCSNKVKSNSLKLLIIPVTAGIDLYNSGLSSEHIAMILPIPAAFAESIPEIASSTTIHSDGESSRFFAAIS